MKKLLKKAGLIIVAATLFVSIFGCTNPDLVVPDTGVTFYGFEDKISLQDYLPLKTANNKIKAGNGIAFAANSPAYADGESVKTHYGNLTEIDGETLYVYCDLLKEIYPECKLSGRQAVSELANSLDKNVFVYKNKLVIITDRNVTFDEFTDCFSIQILCQTLTMAEQAEIDNAFIDLPNAISNNKTIVINYTDPDLDLGIQTTMYDLQDNGSTVVPKGPKIVVGEGNNAENHTIVRVYNEYQAKTAQFLAFPANVKGGVKVQASYVPYNGFERSVIVTAANNSSQAGAKTVRVFDEYGLLYMEIVPKFAGSISYNIVTGDFDSSNNGEELLVMLEFADNEGNIPYTIYSLADGNILLENTLNIDSALAGFKFEASLKKNDGNDNIIMFSKDALSAFIFNPSNGEFTNTGISIPSNANGVYDGGDNASYLVSITKSGEEASENQSFVRVYNNDDKFGTEIDVGYYENIFWWNAGVKVSDFIAKKYEFEDTDYVKEAPFIHERVDLGNKAINTVTKKNGVANLINQPYSSWAPHVDYTKLHKTTCVWEPCFTHRWNCTQAMGVMNDYKDENGDYIFTSYGKDNQRVNYRELDSAFYVGTYAEGLIELEKMRIYPLRQYLEGLAAEFRIDAEMLAGLEPIHEIEINVDGSVGDYNPNMIKGFAAYLLDRFGSVEAINKKFGTSFASKEDIDAPRDGALGDRGDWDKYKGNYFEQWSLYTRQIVNKRLTEAFREALLAGFPPEIITGHSIPEGDAISGFLGQADTRMSPIDTMMVLGCGFGATRYGVWYNDSNNFLGLAYRAGFKNITLSEYNVVAGSIDASEAQMNYLWNNGARYVNILNVSNDGTRCDLISLSNLSKKNAPRPGYTGGTISSKAVTQNGKSYNIVQIGDSDNNGLLKSILDDGSWEGTVYLVPFHSFVTVEDLELKKNVRGGTISGEINDLQTGDVAEVTFIASYKGSGSAKAIVEVIEDGVVNERLTSTFDLTDKETYYRFVLNNDVVLGSVKISVRYEADEINKVEVTSINGDVMRESIARKYFGDLEAKPYVGGVSFDILSREMVG